MSSNSQNLRTDVATARKYIELLSNIEGVYSIGVGGSRSPKSTKTARIDSDWDIHVLMVNPCKLPSPRSSELHGEVHAFTSARKRDVEVWPSDKHGILKDG